MSEWNKQDINEMFSIDSTIDSVLANCVKVSRQRVEWVAAEIYQKALDEIRKRDKKIKYLQHELWKERIKNQDQSMESLKRKVEAQRKELRRFNATTPEYRLKEEFERGRDCGFNEAMAQIHERERPVNIVVARAYQEGRRDAMKEQNENQEEWEE